MPSVFSHAVVAIALSQVPTQKLSRVKLWALSVSCSVLPDADVVTFFLGIPYRDMLGHRGLTHSLSFALAIALLVATLFPEVKRQSKDWWVLFGYFFVVTASHGLLDAITNGGLGVAFFAPFDETRYFLPWRPIEVSPIGLDFFGPEGLGVIRSELVWLWIPSALLAIVVWACKRLQTPVP